MNAKKFVPCICLVLIAAMAATAYAQPGKGRRAIAPDGDGLFPGCPVNLDLSAEQKVKIQEQRRAFFKDTADLRADIFKKRQELDILMLEPTVDAEQAKKIQDGISSLRAQMAQKRLQAQLNTRAVLTPEQIKLLPPGCNMGIGPGGRGCGMGPGAGRGGRGGRRGPGGGGGYGPGGAW